MTAEQLGRVLRETADRSCEPADLLALADWYEDRGQEWVYMAETFRNDAVIVEKAGAAFDAIVAGESPVEAVVEFG